MSSIPEHLNCHPLNSLHYTDVCLVLGAHDWTQYLHMVQQVLSKGKYSFRLAMLLFTESRVLLATYVARVRCWLFSSSFSL